MSGLLEEFNRQIKDETSRKSFAARLAGIYNWTDDHKCIFNRIGFGYSSIDRKLKISNVSEEDVDNMGPVDIGIARSIMNKVLSSIINKYNYGVYRLTPSLNAHVSVSNLHTFWQLREIMEYRSMIGIHLSWKVCTYQ
jgi:hypothetical protein